MEDIIQIILTLDPRKIRFIDVLSNANSTSNNAKLYRAIVNGDVTNDDEAADLIYGDKAAKSTTKFINFKRSFESSVYNTLLFINTENDTWDSFDKTKFEANREWLIIHNLVLNSLRSLAIKNAEALLKRTIYYEYTEITVELLGVIKSYYSLKGNIKTFEIKQKEFEHYEELLHAERKARGYSESLKVRYVKSVAYHPENANLAKEYHTTLKPYLEKYNSYSLHLNAFLVEVYIYSTVDDYAGWLGVVERALDYISTKPFTFKSALSSFWGQKCVAATHLREYDIALEAIEKSIAYAIKDTFNWFKFLESKMFLLFRMKRYQEAYNTYTEVTKLSGFKTLDGLNKEMWQLFFVHFYLIDKLDIALNLPPAFAKSTDGHSIKNFNFKKFTNDAPTLEHDKRGMNLILLVLELCVKIAQGKDFEIIDREESIKKYLARYTDKNDHNYRGALFGKMLLVLARFQGNKQELKTNLKPLLDDFSKPDNRISEAVYRSEPIELEDVWNMLLERIGVEI